MVPLVSPAAINGKEGAGHPGIEIITIITVAAVDGGKIIITSSWGEKTERPCRFIDEYHTEIGNNIFHICEFAERMEQNGATYEPKPTEPQTVTKAPKHKDLER